LSKGLLEVRQFLFALAAILFRLLFGRRGLLLSLLGLGHSLGARLLGLVALGSGGAGALRCLVCLLRRGLAALLHLGQARVDLLGLLAKAVDLALHTLELTVKQRDERRYNRHAYQAPEDRPPSARFRWGAHALTGGRR